jgi:Putative prokaryotic signal transducing protein
MVKVITIAKFGDIISANLAKQYLEGENIAAFLMDETTIHYGWHLTTALGGVRLQVPEPMADAARSALASMSMFDRLLPSDSAESETSENEPSAAVASSQIFLDGGEDDDVVRLSWADRMVERMLRTAVLGFYFFPLQFYSIWLFVRLLVSGRQVSPNQYWKIVISCLLNNYAPVVTVALLSVYKLLLR